MAKKTVPKNTDEEQSKRFVETAKSLDVDESGKAFERAMRVISRKAPYKEKKK